MSHPPEVQLIDAPGGPADCPGYRFAGVAADIRETGTGQPDLSLLTSDAPASAAGVFTQNDLRAAPVLISQQILGKSAGKIGGWIANSGNANACTGQQGMSDAREMGALCQIETGIGRPFLVCSTGRIGRPLPMAKLRKGIPEAARARDNSGSSALDAADAILTSDTRRKLATARFFHNETTVTVAGMAKGAGMIEPDMATMLAFLTTDLGAPPDEIQLVLREAVEKTFNRISIDGDMSTNDTVLLLANGASGVSLDPSSPAELREKFEQAVFLVCDALAEKIVGDGEKVTKLVELVVEGAPSAGDAEKVARAIGNSLLVKTSWYGADPNWGRIADAAGYARVGLREEHLDIFYDEVPAVVGGVPREQNHGQWCSIVARNRFRITVNLHLGTERCRLLASDLSEAYVDFNKSE